jgi:processive 1,2-diacylglycerol beta-glucosyltransferase
MKTTGARPLLSELHAHTTWSDGTLTLRELVDLYGQNGFDVLCVTDHILRTDDPFLPDEPDWSSLDAASFGEYLAAVDAEALRARALYDLVVIAGAELTDTRTTNTDSAHAVAVGLRRFVSVDDGLEAALGKARAHGAALVAAHPYPAHAGPWPERATQRWGRDWQALAPLVDRWELFNGRNLYGWVADAGLPGIANGDFHRPTDLAGWKTVLPCAQDAESVVEHLRSGAPVYLTSYERTVQLAAAA